MAKKPEKELTTYVHQAMRNIDSKLSKQKLNLEGDRRAVVIAEIKQAITNLMGKRMPKYPQSPKVQQKIEVEAATVFQGIQQTLIQHAPPELTGAMMEIVRNEVVRAVGLRIAGKGNLPEDVARLKGFEHDFDPQAMAEAMISSGEKRQVASSAIGQLITAGITNHAMLRDFLLRVLMCTDAQGVFSIVKFEKMEPYPKGNMGVETLNLIIRYAVAKAGLKEKSLKKITGIEQAKPSEEDDSDDV